MTEDSITVTVTEPAPPPENSVTITMPESYATLLCVILGRLSGKRHGRIDPTPAEMTGEMYSALAMGLDVDAVNATRHRLHNDPFTTSVNWKEDVR